MKLLVAVDGSTLSEEVLPFVTKLARESQAVVILMTVATHAGDGTYYGYRPKMEGSGTPVMGTPVIVSASGARIVETRDQALARVRSEATDYLGDLAIRLKEGGVDATTRVLVGEDVPDSILACAKTEQVDLIVMATHGRSGIRGITQGSVASQVLRSGEFPVALMRPKRADQS